MSTTPFAEVAAGLRLLADGFEAMGRQQASGRPISGVEMLTPEEACILVAGRGEDGRPRISERTLSRRTAGKDFRRTVGRKVTYERAGLEKWLRTR